MLMGSWLKFSSRRAENRSWRRGCNNPAGELMLGNLVMIGVGLLLIYLGIAKKMEPLLLVPIGIGAVLVNIPGGGLAEEGSIFDLFLKYLIHTEIVPLLIFLGLGALTDFSPLLANPKTFLLGAAAQIGIFAALIAALFLGFTPQEAASIGIIGGLMGPQQSTPPQSLPPIYWLQLLSQRTATCLSFQ